MAHRRPVGSVMTERQPSASACALAEALAALAERVRTCVGGLRPEQWRARCDADGWTVGFETWHIARAIERQRGWIEASLRGEVFPFDWEATHALNAETSATYGDPDPEATVALLLEQADRTVALLASLGDADLERECLETDGRRVSVKLVAARVMPRHITGHLVSIEQALTTS